MAAGTGVHSIVERISPSAVRDEPFPHVVVENALPADYYAELEAGYPSLDYVAGPGSLENNTLYLKSAAEVLEDQRVPAVWREFFAYHCSQAFFREVCDFWRTWIERLHPDLEQNFAKPLDDFTVGLRRAGKHEEPENRSSDVMMDCQFGTSSPVREVSSMRGPHVDNRAKLFAALLYFRHVDDDSTGAELELHRLKGSRYPKRQSTRIDSGLLECAERIPYGRNKLVMWLNSALSIHGVSPRSVTRMPRRYVNFLGECYAGRREDYFTAFPARRLWPRRVLERLRA